MESWVKWLVGVVGMVLGAVFTPPLVAAIMAMVCLFWLDAASAMLATTRNGGTLDPQVAYEGRTGRGGWRRKVNELILVLAVAVMQALAQYLGDMDLGRIPGATIVASGFAFVELMSIARNTVLAGFDNPILKQWFQIGEISQGQPRTQPEIN